MKCENCIVITWTRRKYHSRLVLLQFLRGNTDYKAELSGATVSDPGARSPDRVKAVGSLDQVQIGLRQWADWTKSR